MFQVIKRTDYSLRALIFLAQQGDRVVARDEIVKALGVPSESFALALKHLAKHRLLHSFRGTGGGFKLGRSASEITLRQVVEAVEGPITLNRCLLDAASCDRQTECNVQGVWRNVQNQLISILDSISLEELANDNRFGNICVAP